MFRSKQNYHTLSSQVVYSGGMNTAILIATRNRPNQISQLLESIIAQSHLPEQVVIVSSGQEISKVVKRFSGKVNITHEHLMSYGQIRQKTFGIRKIFDNVEWVLFLDDDLILRPDTLTKLENFLFSLKENPHEQVIGIGLKIPSSSHLRNSRRRRLIAKLFLLDSKKPGSVLKSGHPVDYLTSGGVLKTQWLNGISVWRADVLGSYNFDFLDSKYSAFEDVIFSFRQNSNGSLIFNPEIEIDLQTDQSTDLSRKDIFLAASFWRLKFILENSGFSKIGFIWSQIGRSIFFILQDTNSIGIVIDRFITTCRVFFEIIFQIVVKRDANWSLLRNCTTQD